jgi:SPX domain protein involved in polyphosphate accumulation
VTAHKLQTSRFELKYVIEEQRARAIRDFVRGYLDPDENVRDTHHCTYPIHSLYLDTPSLLLCRQSVYGLKNRFKLRIRFYDDVPAHPAFLEIKRRLTDVIRKERAMASREWIDRFLQGHRLDWAMLTPGNAQRQAEGALRRFCETVETLRARPAVYVSYLREAYVSPNSDQLRVTFDREISAAPFDRRRGLAMPTAGVRADVGGVVLELKFLDRFPLWMRELVRTFDLDRRSVAKYVYCVEALQLQSGPGLEASVKVPVRAPASKRNSA